MAIVGLPTPAPAAVIDTSFEDRVAGALWGIFIADAIAMPAHWYYDGPMQIISDYHGPITGYVQPKFLLENSIMNKSNTGGGGRGSFDGNIIGEVINHGKKKYWNPDDSHHYHCTLQKGENTLDAQLVRLVIKIIGKSKGRFSPTTLRNEYMKFMTTPGSHNDAYASTTHRMFFSNRARGLPIEECPDNDGKNVDTVDGILMSVPVTLAYLSNSRETSRKKIGECIGVTRKSSECVKFAASYDEILRGLLSGKALRSVLERAARPWRLKLEESTKGPDPISQ